MPRNALKDISRFLTCRTFCALAGILLIAGCANQVGEELNSQSRSMVGMSKAQLVSCAGRPQKSLETDGGELLTYSVGLTNRTPSTAGTVGVGVGGGSRSGVGVGVGVNFPLGPGFSQSYCEAVFRMQGGSVSDVTYNASSSIRGTGHRVCYEIVGSCLNLR